MGGMKQALNTRVAGSGWVRRVVTPTERGANDPITVSSKVAFALVTKLR